MIDRRMFLKTAAVAGAMCAVPFVLTGCDSDTGDVFDIEAVGDDGIRISDRNDALIACVLYLGNKIYPSFSVDEDGIKFKDLGDESFRVWGSCSVAISQDEDATGEFDADVWYSEGVCRARKITFDEDLEKRLSEAGLSTYADVDDIVDEDATPDITYFDEDGNEYDPTEQIVTEDDADAATAIDDEVADEG